MPPNKNDLKNIQKFKVGQYAVYPGHGVGKVVDIQTKEILGKACKFYSVSILNSGMRIMIPIDAVEAIGLRKVMSKATALKVLKVLTSQPIVVHKTWNHRYREYMETIRTGEPLTLAQVLAELKTLQVDKELSFGERKMLDFARSILNDEISVVLNELGDFK